VIAEQEVSINGDRTAKEELATDHAPAIEEWGAE
jgi:hypothetical protein